MNSIINHQENFQTHNINTLNKRHLLGPMPTYLLVKKVQFMLASKFSTGNHLV
jgi:hypothetical protein